MTRGATQGWRWWGGRDEELRFILENGVVRVGWWVVRLATETTRAGQCWRRRGGQEVEDEWEEKVEDEHHK